MQLPSTRIAAYDISDGHFPLPEYRPSNVTFDSLDFLGEIPSSMVGQFDVVHLRTWAFIIRDNDPSRLIQNASKLLSGFLFLVCMVEIVRCTPTDLYTKTRAPWIYSVGGCSFRQCCCQR